MHPVTNDDKVIRALVRRLMDLTDQSPEYQILAHEILANAKLAYGEAARDRLQILVAEVVALKEAESLLGKRLDFAV